MTGRPLVVVTTLPTTLFTVAPEDKPIKDFDSTVRRGPLDVITGNETGSTMLLFFIF